MVKMSEILENVLKNTSAKAKSGIVGPRCI